MPKGFHKVRYYGIWHASSHHPVSKLARQMAITDASNQLNLDPPRNNLEEPEGAGHEIKCPYCGGLRLERLQKLPRPRARSPSAEMFARFYERASIAADLE